MKIFLKNKSVIIICFLSLVLLPLLRINAGPLDEDTSGKISTKVWTVAALSGFEGVSNNTASEIVATVIKAFLGLLGVIFIFLVVIAGYKYMTANGDEGQVEDALGSIKTAIIGLIIIVSAYAITAFVFKNISTDGSSGATPTTVSP